MNRCKLYRNSDLHKDKDIDEDPLQSFEKVLNEESRPFHDAQSVEFLEKTCGITFTDAMHFKRFGKQYALHRLSVDIKVYLMVLRNSRQGIYTDIGAIDKRGFFYREYTEEPEKTKETDEVYPAMKDVIEKVGNIHSYLWERKEDNLFAYNVECEGPGQFLFYGFEIECYYPLKIENYQIEPGKTLVVKDEDEFFDQFQYDWRRDLPDIKQYIDEFYEDYKILLDHKNYCTLYDFMFPYSGKETDRNLSEYRIVNHMTMIPYYECHNKYLPLVIIKYMEDGSVELCSKISSKYPYVEEIIGDCMPEEKVKYTFFLVPDIWIICRPKDFQKIWFGGYAYEDYTEIYSKDQSLLEFSKQIPEILKKMKTPV